MKNPIPEPQIEESQEGLEKKNVPNNRKNIPNARKGAEFMKGQLVKRQGHRFRVDHLRIYKIHAALKGISQQELINEALEYYKINVLQKTGKQKLIDAGQEELNI